MCKEQWERKVDLSAMSIYETMKVYLDVIKHFSLI